MTTITHLHQSDGTDEQAKNDDVLRTFTFGSLTLRLAEIDSKGKLWFVAKDICDALGYPDTDGATRKLRKKDTRTKRIRVSDAPRWATIVTEAGLYRLLLRSNKSAANKFSDWVTDKVLPEIRRTGSYSMPGSALAPSPAPAAVTDPAVLALLTELVAVNRQTLEDSRARERLARFLPSWQIPHDRLRARMDDLIDTVSEVRGWPRNSVIRQLNRVVRDKHHVDFCQRKSWVDRKAGKRVSILSVVEHYGKLPMVYDFAVAYYRDDLMSVPTPRLSDVPLDRDDPMTEEDRDLQRIMAFAMGSGEPKP